MVKTGLVEAIDSLVSLDEHLATFRGVRICESGPITLKVYREDETNEVISNFEVSDLHLAEWKEVILACPDRKEKGWKTIYGLIKTKMEYLNQTKKELKIDFNKPLKEQDPLDELNDLANKKIKRTGDIKDHSKSTKKNKSSIQHEEEVLRRSKIIFTSVYVVVQKLKTRPMILASVEKVPLVWPSITVDGVTRLKEYELTPAEAIQADCDIKAINIILQGLPTKIYLLVESTSCSQGSLGEDLNCS
ncbi:hypothetical protein Tco_1020910 [Tanacetum coccineum]